MASPFVQASYAVMCHPTVARLEARSGPAGPQAYAFVVETLSLYRWAPNDTSERDGVLVLTHTDGSSGRWLKVCTGIG